MPALGQRLVALAAAALVAGVFGVALSQAGRDSPETALPDPAVGLWGGWTTVLAGVAPAAPRAGRRSGCDWVVLPRTQGVVHPTLPCGARIFVEFGGRRCELDRHLKGRNSRDPRLGFRLYFFWDDDTEQVVVGWLPNHLETRAT